jgi:dTDP-4-dehydrorhamnose reductase
MKESVLITGGGGQLGVELVRAFSAEGWNVKAFDRKSLDITDSAQVSGAVEAHDAGFVINAAAYNQVDLAETDPEGAWRANALAVRNLAVACRNFSAQLVHFSTDYVFDGTKGNSYVETDPTHPIGAYAVSKLTGELYAQAYLPNPLIIRTSGVFGPGGMFTPRGNFPELMLRLAQSGSPVRVVNDFVASPTYAPAMATRTLELLKAGCTGVFHMGGGEAISWFDYAQMIFDAARVSPNLEPTNESTFKTAARRPKYSALSNQKLDAAGITPMPKLRAAVGQYFEARQRTTAHRSS